MRGAFSCHRHPGRTRPAITLCFSGAAFFWLTWWLGALGAALTVVLMHRDFRANVIPPRSLGPLVFEPAALEQGVLWQWAVCLMVPRDGRWPRWPQRVWVYRDEVSPEAWARLRRQLVTGADQPVGFRNSS